MRQRRYPEALAAYAEARERFTALDEPGSVAVFWHQTGMVHQRAGQPVAAEKAYRESLAIEVGLDNAVGQASTLGQLGNLYDNVLERPEEAAQWGMLRVRDFTPCSDAVFEEQYPGAPVHPGGAEAFLDFIQDELTPFLASRLPLDATDQTLVGASLGGLFALYAMLRRPGVFQRVVTVSPAIYWGGRTLFELEASLGARVQDLPVKLFLAAGSLEEAHDPRCGLVSNLYGLEARLRGRLYPGLDMALLVFEGENHMSVFPGAVTRGLGHVFGGYPDMHDWSRALRA